MQTNPLRKMLLIDRKGDKCKNSTTKPPKAKPNICMLPKSDLMERMNAFAPFLSGAVSAPSPPVLSDSQLSGGAVQFVPVSDSESDSSRDSDSGDSDDEGEATQGPHVEMRLAVVPDNDSDSDDDPTAAEDGAQLGEVTEQNMRLPGQTNKTKPPPVIEELN